MKGVKERYLGVDKITEGVATISAFSVSEEAAQQFNMSLLFGGGRGFQAIKSGDYVRLSVNGELMMSDTPFERRTNLAFVDNAKGRVMIAGLGVGLILNALKEKVLSGKVSSIVVYEKYQDVIDLVASRYSDLPLEVRCEDILTYKPSKEERYDTIYFDIWPTVSTDNLPEMALLHQRWKTHKEKGGWMSSWMVDYLRNERRASQRCGWY